LQRLLTVFHLLLQTFRKKMKEISLWRKYLLHVQVPMSKFKKTLFIASEKLLFKNMILSTCILKRYVKLLELRQRVLITKSEQLHLNYGPLLLKKKLKENQKELAKIL